YAVEMQRLPAKTMLDAMLRRGEVRTPLIDRIAALLAAFHARCATGPGVDEHATPEAMRRQSNENFAQLDPFIGNTISAAMHAQLRTWCGQSLDEHAALMHTRIHE